MRQCAELVFVPPRFDVYRTVSRQIHAIFGNAPRSSNRCVDEADPDATEKPAAADRIGDREGDLHSHSRRDQSDRIVVFLYNKFLAKLASSQRKPNGQFVITPEMWPDFVGSLPVNKFHGVGPFTAAKMQSLGIETGADLKASRSPSCGSISGNRPRGISASHTAKTTGRSLRALAEVLWLL